jgi:hypothetical protein
MPYIKPEDRVWYEKTINELANALGTAKNNEIMSDMAGDMNYCISTLIGKVMGKPSYAKIAIITGVLENVKQEFYRRVGVPYEENKIVQNGDIKEYRRLYP